MCVFPTFAAKISVLVIIPIALALCLADIVTSIINLNTSDSPENLLYMNLIISILYLVALCVGFYGTFVRRVVCIQLMLFVIAAYLLVKAFIWIASMNSSKTDDEKIVHFAFKASFMGSVLTFLLAFIYSLRLKELENNEGY